MSNNLYPYQEMLVEKSLEPSMRKGKMILPTASGKGVICREIIYRMISSPANNFNQFLGIIFTPRLLLNKQWVNDFKKHFKNLGRPCNIAIVGSDSMSKEEVITIKEALTYIEEKEGIEGVDDPISTTNYKELVKFVEDNKRNGVNTIVISTYHSNAVIRSSNLTFDCAVYDEAHYLPGREPQAGATRATDELFMATEIKANKKIFTTATEKLGDSDGDPEVEYNGRGFENENIYGAEILSFWKGKERRTSPRDLIEFGSILEPRVYVITDNDIEKYNIERILDVAKITPKKPMGQRYAREVAKVTFKAFQSHRRELKKESDFPDKIGAKMLVVCDGIKELHAIRKSKEIIEFKKKNKDVKVYFIDSTYGIDIHGCDNQKYSNKSKKDFLDALNILRSEENAIIYHVDILTCGIDIPALTGILFFRECKTIKLLQNIGRASRLHKEDRERWWVKEEIKPGGEGYIKPSFHIMLPILKENIGDFVNSFVKVINKIRNNYGFKAYEFVHIGATKEPDGKVGEDPSGIKTPLKQLTDKAGRVYYEWIEDKKKIREERKIRDEAEQLMRWEDNEEWDKIEEWIAQHDKIQTSSF